MLARSFEIPSSRVLFLCVGKSVLGLFSLICVLRWRDHLHQLYGCQLDGDRKECLVAAILPLEHQGPGSKNEALVTW